MAFTDHFSGLAAQYARHRPRYPMALAARWGDPGPRRLRWEIHLRVGRA